MRGLLIALTFLTRIPFPAPEDVSQEEFTKSQSYYPAVGLIIGLILWAGAKWLSSYYPPLVTGALILVLELILTGGLHLDGFMDSMDALLSARPKEKMLEIMKDSRVGAHASMSLAGLLLLKFSLLASLAPASYKAIILMPALSRWAFLIGVLCFPYARSAGLGQGFHTASRQRILVFLLEGLALLVLSVWLLGPAGPVTMLCSALFVYLLGKRVSSLLGGLTGDIYGASIELTEVVFLLLALPISLP